LSAGQRRYSRGLKFSKAFDTNAATTCIAVEFFRDCGYRTAGVTAAEG
jgi:hypothetical protein